MVCGHGVQLSGSFQRIQSWCQYSAGPRAGLVRTIMPSIWAKSPNPISPSAWRVGGHSASRRIIGLSSNLIPRWVPWYLVSG